MTDRSDSRSFVGVLHPRARPVLIAYGLVSIVQVTSVALDMTLVASIAQVLMMPVLALTVLAATPAPRPRLVRVTLAALAFSWLGDSAPRLLDGDPAFLAMVGFFLGAQICFIVAFGPYLGDSIARRDRGWLAAYAVVVVVLIAICLPGAGVLAPAVLVYGLSLGTMAVLATGVDRLAWVGGAFFLVSDGLIAIDAFSDLDLPGHDVSVMATYVVAQLLLVLGVIRRAASEGPPHIPTSSDRGSTAAPGAGPETQPPVLPSP